MDITKAFVVLWWWLTGVWLLLAAQGALAVHNVPDGHALHHALHHFDVLHKNHLQHKHVSKTHREVHFTTLERNFRMHLFPRKRLFHRNVQVHVVEGGRERRLGIHFNHFYEGHLHDEPDSIVVAHLDHGSGLLTASISTQQDHYYIEPSHHHIHTSHDFHMISYRTSDLKYNLTRDPSLHFCGVATHRSPLTHNLPPDGQWGKPFLTSSPHTLPHQHPLEKHGQPGRVQDRVERTKEKGRLKRQASSTFRDSCPMELVATHSFVRVYGREGVSDVIQFLIQLIDAMDQEIYRTTDWTGDSQYRGLSIKRIRVLTDPTEAGQEPVYNRLPPAGGWDSNVLLGHFSHANWSDVCLSHLFTSETFSDGRLGVAYIASPAEGQTGGICSQTRRDFNGGEIATANVGISTLYNGRRLLLAEAQLITGHEIGHNWGSDHDPIDRNSVCNPLLDNGGKFLMYQSANDGTLPNNYKFSACSQVEVRDVLTAKSLRCFETTSDVPSQCGNYEVEEGEECDAGLEGMVDNDACCDSQCRLRSTATCSDVNDACCRGCQFADSNTICKEYAPGNFECLESIKCNGMNSKCPVDSPLYVPIETSCLVDGKCYPPSSICDSGSCTVDPSADNSSLTCFDVCALHNKTKCFCSGEDDCKTCCKSRADASCDLLMINNNVLFLPDRTTCVGGLCMGGVCELTTPDLVNRLYRLFADISIDEFVRFMRENIVHSVLFLMILVWIPGSLLIHFCIDVKVWHKLVDRADKTEQERLDMNQEDDLDYQYCKSIADDNPDVDFSKARKGLQRMASRTESVYSYEGSYGLPSPAFEHPGMFELDSPPRSGRPRLSIIPEEPNRDLDPSMHNILAYKLSSSVHSETRV